MQAIKEVLLWFKNTGSSRPGMAVHTCSPNTQQADCFKFDIVAYIENSRSARPQNNIVVIILNIFQKWAEGLVSGLVLAM